MNNQSCLSERVVGATSDVVADDLPAAPLDNSSPQVGFYQAGRFANVFRWNIAQAFLLASRSRFAAAERSLNQLIAALHALPSSAPEQLVKQIMAARDTLRDAFRSEAHFEMLASAAEEYQTDDRLSREACCRRLYNDLVEQHVERVRDILLEAAAGRSDCEAAFRLGQQIDQGPRRADVYEYLHTSAMAAHRRVEPTADEEEESQAADEPRPAWAMLADTKREAGELPPDESWLEVLAVLCRQAGLNPEQLPRGDLDASDVRPLVDRIDDQVNEHFKYSELRRQLAAGEIKPVWDDERRHLRVGDVIVKNFSKTAAKNQSRLLAAFQEKGWPPRVSCPLPPTGGLVYQELLRTTVRDLHKTMLADLIRFRGDGTGEGVCWEVRKIG